MKRNDLRSRYDRTRATNYVCERGNDPRWEMEHQAVATLLEKLASGSRVLDIPVGTGRFIELYKDLQLTATGVDASNDMLNEARAMANRVGADIGLLEGDIFSLKFEGERFDSVVCMRFLNWVGPDDLVAAIREMSRVSRDSLIVAIEQYAPLSSFRLLNWSDLRRILLQAKRRFFMWRTRNDYVYHSSRKVVAAIQQCGLQLEEQIQIPRKKDEGIEYNVFRFKKVPSAR